MREEKLLKKILDLTKSGKIAWTPEHSDRPGGSRQWTASLLTKDRIRFKFNIDEGTPRTLHITVDGNMILYKTVDTFTVRELTDYVCSGQQRFKEKKLDRLGRHLDIL